jgi:hypothetical protein
LPPNERSQSSPTNVSESEGSLATNTHSSEFVATIAVRKEA